MHQRLSNDLSQQFSDVLIPQRHQANGSDHCPAQDYEGLQSTIGVSQAKRIVQGIDPPIALIPGYDRSWTQSRTLPSRIG